MMILNIVNDVTNVCGGIHTCSFVFLSFKLGNNIQWARKTFVDIIL